MPRRLAIVGPTASGKTALALELARKRQPAELLSMDAMAVYRGMDIGTATPTATELAGLKCLGINLTDPGEDFSVGAYQAAVRPTLAAADAGGAEVVAVGGTGLYARAVIDELAIPGRYLEVRAKLEATADTAALYERLRELDPVAAQRTGPQNRRRIVRALEVTLGSGRPFSSYGPGLESYGPSRFTQLGLRMPRSLLDARIAARYEAQMEAGFLEEVRRLQQAAKPLSRTARHALGYRELLAHLEGQCSLAEALAEAVRRTRKFARRQERWFRRDPRIQWLDVGEDPLEVLPIALEIFDRCT